MLTKVGSWIEKFQSTPSARRATRAGETAGLRAGRFQSTPSARRATGQQSDREQHQPISIHALREEGDWFSEGDGCESENFNPRPPRGGRQVDALCLTRRYVISIHALREEGDAVPGLLSCSHRYFNPRPPRGGRPDLRAGQGPRSEISIHALREEGDPFPAATATSEINFNPRPPRGGRRSCAACGRISSVFQSTPSARRATKAIRSLFLPRSYFNPRPPRGGRQSFGGFMLFCKLFQSTPSARRATRVGFCRASAGMISIHALREEGDSAGAIVPAFFLYFNPRPPRGGRPLRKAGVTWRMVFQSTPSARRATAKAAKNPPRLFHYTHLCTI